jgi:hypothetical protein
MTHVREEIYKAAKSAITGGEGAKLTHGQARDVMKIGLQAVRITKKVTGEHDLVTVHNVWSTDALESLIEQVERSPEYKKASGLSQVMKEMKTLVGGVKKKNAERATRGLQPKKEMKEGMQKKRKAEEIANEGGTGDENGRPKKKRIEAGAP